MILAVLAAVNFLANRYDKSYDATANKQFTLSDQTLKVVKDLKRDVTSTYFGETARFRTRATCWTATPPCPQVQGELRGSRSRNRSGQAAGFRSDSPVVVENGVRKEAPRASPRKKSPAR